LPSTKGYRLHYTLGEYLLDLVQNSIEADAQLISLEIVEEQSTTGGTTIRVVLQDDGKGMDRDVLARVLDPFYTDGVKHPGRSVGLGLPFLKQMVESVDGTFHIESVPAEGTRLEFSYPGEHVDAPPKDGISDSLQRLFCFDGDYELHVVRRGFDSGYILQRSELKDVLGDLETVGSQSLLAEYISSQEESLDTQ